MKGASASRVAAEAASLVIRDGGSLALSLFNNNSSVSQAIAPGVAQWRGRLMVVG